MGTSTSRPQDENLPQPAVRRRAVFGGAAALGAAALIGSPYAARAVAGGAPAAKADAGGKAAPAISGCDAWGAKPPTKPVKVLARPTKIVVHHTSSPNSTDTSQAHAFDLARQIQGWHFDRGWIDSGQQFTISRGGHMVEGRHRSLETLNGGTSMIEGAHTEGQNTVAIGIENEGTYNDVEPPAELYARLVEMCAYICTQYGLPPSEIYGHRDFNDTDCPGHVLYAMLPKLRSDVAAKVGGSSTAVTWTMLRPGAGGTPVRVMQHLLRHRGASLPVTGSYDAATREAVKAFQGEVDIQQDGIAGNRTWNQLIFPVEPGSSGEAVRAVQTALAAHGKTAAPDGAFGPATVSAVKSLQTRRSLRVTGTVDAPTWSALVG